MKVRVITGIEILGNWKVQTERCHGNMVGGGSRVDLH